MCHAENKYFWPAKKCTCSFSKINWFVTIQIFHINLSLSNNAISFPPLNQIFYHSTLAITVSNLLHFLFYHREWWFIFLADLVYTYNVLFFFAVYLQAIIVRWKMSSSVIRESLNWRALMAVTATVSSFSLFTWEQCLLIGLSLVLAVISASSS